MKTVPAPHLRVTTKLCLAITKLLFLRPHLLLTDSLSQKLAEMPWKPLDKKLENESLPRWTESGLG